MEKKELYTFKVKCENCDHICENTELLEDDNPFDFSQIIQGCPKCYYVNSSKQSNSFNYVSSALESYMNLCELLNKEVKRLRIENEKLRNELL